MQNEIIQDIHSIKNILWNPLERDVKQVEGYFQKKKLDDCIHSLWIVNHNPGMLSFASGKLRFEGKEIKIRKDFILYEGKACYDSKIWFIGKIISKMGIDRNGSCRLNMIGKISTAQGDFDGKMRYHNKTINFVRGTMTLHNGTTLKGEFSNEGKLNKGVMKKIDGSKYQGIFSALTGKLKEGTYYGIAGERVQGIFEDGELIKGTKWLIDGTKLTGKFSKSILQIGTRKDCEGNKVSGSFENKKLQKGIIKDVYGNKFHGSLREGSFEKGVKEIYGNKYSGEFNENGVLVKGKVKKVDEVNL